jgi:hypothetical protein
MKPICGIVASALVIPSVVPVCADDIVHKCIEISEPAVCSRISSGARCPRGKRGEWVKECVKTGGKIADEQIQMMLDALEHRHAFEAAGEPQR